MLCYAYVGNSYNIFSSLIFLEIVEKKSAVGFVWGCFGKLFRKIIFGFSTVFENKIMFRNTRRKFFKLIHDHGTIYLQGKILKYWLKGIF